MHGRQLAIALGLLLAAAPAVPAVRAEAPASRPRVGKVSLRVVQILPDTHQALVYDKDSGRHVVLGEGERVGKYEVVEIDDDQVVVQIGTREVVLMVDAAAPPAPAPLDPYPPAPPVLIDNGGLLDPYPPMRQPATSMGATVDARVAIREVLAPTEQRASATPVDPYAPAPIAVTAPAPVVVTGTAPVPLPVVPPAPVPTIEPIRIDAIDLRRADLQAALADFDALDKQLGFGRVGTGVRLARVPAGSYFHRAGFRAGDVVTTIDGAPIRSIDDAAGVYVHLGTARKLAVEVDRAGAHGTLKFALK